MGERKLMATPTRLQRLAEVARGEIAQYGDGHSYDGRQQRVTAGMAELQRAGWVQLGERGAVKTPWVLTDLGHKVRLWAERAERKARQVAR